MILPDTLVMFDEHVDQRMGVTITRPLRSRLGVCENGGGQAAKTEANDFFL